MPRVFVVAPYVPNGGTFMAYHLARILHLDFGFEGWAVRAAGESPDHGVFDYDPVFPSIDLQDLPAIIRDEDILIANPSFSAHCLGLSCRGRKVMYVQGFSTFDLLDCRFDLYVCVSDFTRKFIRELYGIEAPVIPPFIRRDRFPAPRPWAERPADSVLLHAKNDDRRQAVLVEKMREELGRWRPDLRLVETPPGRMEQIALIERLGQVRYLLSLCPAEGFGLVPLEAMAMGTAVVGFDGFGGRDYMRSGENCAVFPWPRLEELASGLLDLLDRPEEAEAMAARGSATAREARFGYGHFRAAWREGFRRLLEGGP